MTTATCTRGAPQRAPAAPPTGSTERHTRTVRPRWIMLGQRRPVARLASWVQTVLVGNNIPEDAPTNQILKAAATAAVSAVPIFGAPASVLLAELLSIRINKRRSEWFAEVADQLEDLSSRFSSLEAEHLAQNDVFVDAVVRAARIAEQTSQEEKIDALRHATVNSALPGAPKEDIQALFFALIADLTPTHLQLLTLLNAPRSWFDQRSHLTAPQFGRSSSREELVKAALPDLATEGQEVIQRFFAGLASSGLVSSSLGGMLTADGAWQSITTDFGQRFLAFIADPGLRQG